MGLQLPAPVDVIVLSVVLQEVQRVAMLVNTMAGQVMVVTLVIMAAAAAITAAVVVLEIIPAAAAVVQVT